MVDNTDGIIFRIDDGSDVGYSDGFFDSSIDRKIVLLIYESLE